MKHKLRIDFIRAPLPKEKALEEKSVEIAKKVFELLTQDNNVAITARAFDYAFRGLNSFDKFIDIFAQSRKQSTVAVSMGDVLVTIEQKLEIIVGKK